MASTIIHMAVANEINKSLKRDNDLLLIGSIAPDLSRQIGESKVESHFLENIDNDIPNIDKFLDKYKNKLSDDFVMGYFIHLYTDYLWFKYFIPEIYQNDIITKLDGTKVKCNGRMIDMYIYNDYTNLNTRLLDEYNMDLSIFYNDLPKINNNITEIPIDKLHVLIDKMSVIIANSKEHKDFVIELNNIKQFIEMSVTLILERIKEIGSE